MISQRFISRFSIRATGLFDQSVRLPGPISDRPISALSKVRDVFPGVSETLKGHIRIVENVVPRFPGNLGVKFGLAQSKSLPCTMSFRSSIHSSSPKEFEIGRDTGSIEGESDTGPSETGSNSGLSEMDGNARPIETGRNTGPFKTGWMNSPLEMERNTRPTDMERNSGPFGTGWNNRPIGMDRNTGLFEIGRDTRSIERVGNTVPSEMDGNARPIETGRNIGPFQTGWMNSPLEMERNTRPTEMGRNSGAFGTGWNNRPIEMDRNTGLFGMGQDSRPILRGWNTRPNETGWNSRSMNFVRGIMEENGRDTIGGSQLSRYGVEQNADVVHIKLMRNNTFVTVTDSKGNKKCGASSGCLSEMKGGPKVSKYGAEATAEYVGRLARNMGLKSVVMKVNGFTHFKKKRQAIMSFRDGHSNSRSDQNPIVYIEDTTRKPHNGCRLRKKRRV